MMKCPKCGFESEGRFCPACGAQLSAEGPSEPVQQLPVEDPSEPVQQLPVESLGEPGAEEQFYREIPPKQKRGFGAFWRKNKRNKVLVIIAAIVLIGIVRSIIGGIGSPDLDAEESYDWPTNDMAQMLPQPEGTITYVSTTDGESLYADVECSIDQYRAFVDGCKENGFDQKQDASQYEDSCTYAAENREAFTLSADYYDGDLSISLNAPEAKASEEDADEEAEEETKEEASAEKKDSSAKDDGEVSPDFKETMDDYEEFMDDYVAFMKKYENSDDTASMLVDYGKMMTRYNEFSQKIEAIDEDELSSADSAYYLEVTGRVTQKLAELY